LGLVRDCFGTASLNDALHPNKTKRRPKEDLKETSRKQPKNRGRFDEDKEQTKHKNLAE
jgi:hypothetical protein